MTALQTLATLRQKSEPEDREAALRRKIRADSGRPKKRQIPSLPRVKFLEKEMDNESN